MEFDFNVREYEYKNRCRNLDVKAAGKVKSEKFFPIYNSKNGEEIFKPLSKTKPLTTPLFAYSEVIWSTITHNYFDIDAPIYKLARCIGYSSEVPKYYEIGTIVPSIIDKDESLVNLYEYFLKHPSPELDISQYENYCMYIYDYKNILNSEFIKNNRSLGEKLSYQILLSILRADQNYHYENILFIYQKDKIKTLASPLDYEFSTYFLFPDEIETNRANYDKFTNYLKIGLRKEGEKRKNRIISDELDLIVENYREVAKSFLEKLEIFVDDLKNSSITLENHNYIVPFSSNDYMAGTWEFKKGRKDIADIFRKKMVYHTIDLNEFGNMIKNEILEVSSLLSENIRLRLDKNDVKKYRK